MCRKPKIGSDSVSENHSMQKFDIRSDSFLTDTACDLQFKLEVKNIFTCIQRADKERFKRLAKQSFDYGPTHHGSHTQLQLSHTRIQSLLTLDVAKMIGHSIVSSQLDYANALLHGTSVYIINRLQMAQNSLVRTVYQTPRSASATALLRQLHWLPV